MVGGGSDQRRKRIIGSKLAEPELFGNLTRGFRRRSRELTQQLQNDLQEAMREHVVSLREALDMVRDENIVTESEQDPGFRRRVELVVHRSMAEIRRIQEMTSS